MKMNKGRLIVFSAPSGCGKGTILAKAFENRPVYYSVSYTTREKREGEQEGVNYFYTTRKEFEKMIDGMKLYTAEEIGEAMRSAGFTKVKTVHHGSQPWIAVLAEK